MVKSYESMIGEHQKEGKLKVSGAPIGLKNKYGSAVVLVSCDCGTKPFSLTPSKFKTEHTKSCGCLHGGGRYNRIAHGATNEPWFWSWKSMLKRTQESSHKSYAKYKDIYVDPRYLTDPWAFFNDIRGARIDSTYSVDRIDSNKGYEPGNMRWATKVEQANNLSSNHPMDTRNIYTIKSTIGNPDKYRVTIDRQGTRITKLFSTLNEARDFRDSIVAK